jgi:hypothetical protein
VIVVPPELRRVALSLQTLLTLVRRRQAEPHPVLAGTPSWHHPDAVADLDRRARDELVGLGLHDGRRLSPEFDDVVGALVRPERELYGWVTTTADGATRRCGVLAASAYQVGLVLVRLSGTDHVALAVVPPSRMAAAFAGELPDVPAARGRPVTLSYEDYRAASEDRDGFGGFRARDNPDAAEMRSLLSRPRLGAGELYAAARLDNGTRRRVERPVVHLDTAQGRWLAERRTDDRGDTVSLTPADSALVTARLTHWLETRPRRRPLP